MLLLTGALIGELLHDIFSEARRLGQYVVQPVEDLSKMLGVKGELLVVWRHFVT
jgi:hypothetical protein